MPKIDIQALVAKIEADKKKIFLVSLCCLVILYIDFGFLLKFQSKGLKAIKPKIIKLKNDINSLTKGLASQGGLKDKQGQKQKPARTKRIISEGQMSLLLQDISDIANANNVKIIKMSPLKEAKSDNWKIALDLSCDYHQFGKFVNALEAAERFMAVEEIRIAANPDSYSQQKVGLVIKTYVKK